MGSEMCIRDRAKTIPKFRESTHHFNLGVLHFFQGEFDTAIKVFEAKMKYANYFFSYDVKLYLLRSYYLTQSVDNLEKTLAAFRQSIRRDKFLSKIERTSNNNTIKVFSKLQKIRERLKYEYRYDFKSDIKKLRKYIIDKPVNISKWLIEQLDELDDNS